MKLPERRSAFAAALTAFVLGMSMPVVAAYAVSGEPQAQADSLASPPPSAATPSASPSGAAQASAIAPAATTPTVEMNEHNQNSIVAIVNDEPVSAYELRQRMALVMSTANIPNTPEMVKKIREQVLEQLETEKLQIQEARRNDITVSSVEVDKRIQGILTDNNMTMDQLKGVLTHGGVTMATLRAQIAAQLLWQKAVQQNYSGRINITPEAVDAELARISEGASKPHYLVSEIFLAVDNPEQDEKILKDAQNLENQIQGGAPFAAIARKFSQSPSAAEGGDIGLVYEGQLAPELSAALSTMKTGDMSPPVRSTGGYYILVLRQRMEPVGTKVPTAQELPTVTPSSLPLARVLLPLPPNTNKTVAENVLKLTEAIRSHITSCAMLPKLVQQVKGALYFDLGNARLSDLSEQIRDVITKTESGGAAPPFLSAAGAELFVRCDKAVPKVVVFPMPTRDQVEQQLFEEQSSALARRYERELKRNADIEAR